MYSMSYSMYGDAKKRVMCHVGFSVEISRHFSPGWVGDCHLVKSKGLSRRLDNTITCVVKYVGFIDKATHRGNLQVLSILW